MNRDANSAALIGNGAGDGLADPPRGISGEAEASLHFELAHRFHQPKVAFLNQVQEGDAPANVFLSNADHQARIGLDQMLAGQQAILDGYLQFPPPPNFTAGCPNPQKKTGPAGPFFWFGEPPQKNR